jgi:hypothetical protein
LECGFGTLLSGGNCTGIINCDTYVSGGHSSCQTCANGFMSFDTTCYVMEGCTDVMSNGGCRGCSDGYTLSGYACIKSIPNVTGCAIFTPMQACMYCLDGYSLYSNVCRAVAGQQGNTTTVTANSATTSGNSGLLVLSTTNNNQQVTVGGSSVGLINNSGSRGFGSSGAPLTVIPQIQSSSPVAPIQTSTVSTVTTSTTSTTKNCNITDESSGRCLRCTYGFYFDPNSNCIAVSPLCQGYNL